MIPLVLWLTTATVKPTTRLEIRATPRLSTATLCSEVLVVAEIKGPEVERFYCPRVEWAWPDGTMSSEESDCPPYETHELFPRFWSKRICLGPNPLGLEWAISVRLLKRNEVIAQDHVSVWVK